MVKELNKTPIRTSNNYNINEIKLDINIPRYNITNDIQLVTDENEKLDVYINKEYKNLFNTKIGLEFDTFYKIKIDVKENMKINNPVYIYYSFNNNDVLIDDIEINVEKNAEAKFIIKYDSINENIKGFHHLKQITKTKENAKTKITILNLINNESDSFIAIENETSENSCIEHNFIDLGGKTKVSNYYTNLIGNGATNNLNNLYLGTNNDVIDMNYNIEILGKKSKCNIDVQGAIDGFSKKNFKGTIDFKEGSVNAIGEENENCVILSDNAKSKSLPMLLCHEENVQGAHGVSSGKIDEDKLFYIMSKGISKKDAEKLIIKANFNSIIKNIEDENLQNEIINIIERKI